MGQRRIGWLWPWIGPGLLLLVAAPFGVTAGLFGLDGLWRGPSVETRFFSQGAIVANGAVFLHMLAGGVVTALVPLQIIGPLRRRWPALHRRMGYVLAGAALVTGLGGLGYIALRGTIGGAPMSLGFATYGLCLAVAAVQTLRLARARDLARHRRWALRLVVLALGSWLYRVLYGLWVLTTGGAGIGSAFDGPFDLAMNWVFFLPGF